MTSAPVRRRPSPVASAAPRLAARAAAERAERRRRRWKRAGEALVLLAPLAGLAWVLLASSWLAVERVQVRGVDRLSADQVLDVAGVRLGTPLARVDVFEVTRAVERLAPVAEVEVQRSWPGTLRIVVTERVAAAGVLRDGTATLVDASGVPFATERRLPAGVVRLEVREAGPDDPSTRAALAVHRRLPDDLRRQVEVVKAAEPSKVVLLLRGGRQVVWGAPGDEATKTAATLALLRLPGKVLDVSAPGVVTRR